MFRLVTMLLFLLFLRESYVSPKKAEGTGHIKLYLANNL
jgi:hypothetical protein